MSGFRAFNDSGNPTAAFKLLSRERQIKLLRIIGGSVWTGQVWLAGAGGGPNANRARVLLARMLARRAARPTRGETTALQRLAVTRLAATAGAAGLSRPTGRAAYLVNRFANLGSIRMELRFLDSRPADYIAALGRVRPATAKRWARVYARNLNLRRLPENLLGVATCICSRTTLVDGHPEWESNTRRGKNSFHWHVRHGWAVVNIAAVAPVGPLLIRPAAFCLETLLYKPARVPLTEDRHSAATYR